jgi:hypothetical protein
LEETTPDSPRGGGDDEVEQEEDEKKQSEVTLPKYPNTEAQPFKKRKVSPQKPSTWKNSRDNKPHLQTILTMDDINLIIVAISDTSKEILQ